MGFNSKSFILMKIKFYQVNESTKKQNFESQCRVEGELNEQIQYLQSQSSALAMMLATSTYQEFKLQPTP